MKTTNPSGAALRFFGVSIRLALFTVGLLLAIGGAYLFLIGFAMITAQELLPGLLDILIGFLFISSGWRLISLRLLSHSA